MKINDTLATFLVSAGATLVIAGLILSAILVFG